MLNLDFLNKYEEKITRSKKIIEQFWSLAIIEKTPATIWIPGYYSLEKGFLCTPGAYNTDKELNLNVQIASIESHLKKLDDVYVPHLDTFIGTPVIASAFGGKVTYFDEKDPWIQDPIIKEYKDIDKIKKPVASEAGMMKRILEWIDYWKIITKERIPVSMTDIQGPLSVAIDLMGARYFYLGMIDDPKRIKKLLEIIGEVTIDFLKILLPKIEAEDGLHEWTGIFFPKGKGRFRLSEDNLISISSEMYLEFLHPCNESILHELEGGLIHWCGDGSNNFENVLATPSLTGIHNSSMGDMDLIINQIDRIDRLNRSAGKGLVYFNSLVLPSKIDSAKKLIERLTGKRGVLNFLFFPLDNYGISFEGKGGYAEIENDPFDILKVFVNS